MIDWQRRLVRRICRSSYSGLLRLCPAELRREFGAEICTVFTEDFDDTWHTRGLAGALDLWRYAACEVIRMALPGLSANPAIAVPALAVGLNILVIGTEVLIYLIYVDPPGASRQSSAFWIGGAIVGCTSILAALTAVATVHGRNSMVVSLGLNSAVGLGSHPGTD
jgi:hypothetical protein